MKKALFSFFALVVAGNGFADPVTQPSPTPMPSYVVGNIVPGYTAAIVAEGYPIGYVANPSLIIVPSYPQPIPTVVLKDLTARRKNEVDLLDTQLKQVPHLTVIPSTGAPVSAAPTRTAGPSLSYDPGTFLNCAKRSLPLLKSAFRAESHGQSETSREIQQPLYQERANESGPSGAGVTCGVYLGMAAVQSPSLREEIKFLSAASNRQGDELKEVIEAFALSHHSSLSISDRAIWNYYWKIISPVAALSSSPIPKFSDLEIELLAIPNDQLSQQVLGASAPGLQPVPLQLSSMLVSARTEGEQKFEQLTGGN